MRNQEAVRVLVVIETNLLRKGNGFAFRFTLCTEALIARCNELFCGNGTQFGFIVRDEDAVHDHRPRRRRQELLVREVIGGLKRADVHDCQRQHTRGNVLAVEVAAANLFREGNALLHNRPDPDARQNHQHKANHSIADAGFAGGGVFRLRMRLRIECLPEFVCFGCGIR
ncbi:MAG TPA: hypothetical protein DDX71_04355 [Ruminococcus sp.]|nr:hypothetical protein [Ruminococcus sp.]